MVEKFLHLLQHGGEILLHALKHTAILLPFIFIIYAVIELLESKADLTKVTRFGSKLGPLIGSTTGLIPQCGFSVMAAKLFEQKYITMGTLFAIFMATSDEAFIIMISSGEGAMWVVPMVLIKILIGVLVGYSVDGIMRLAGRRQVCVELPKMVDGVPTTVHEIFMQKYLQEKDVEVSCACGKSHNTQQPAWKRYFLYPFLHTLKVGGIILAVNFLLEVLMHAVGEDVFVGFMQQNRFLQPVISCAIGLIPNCASSVVITETFLSGGITFGTCVAGLCANAGMGFVVLLRNGRKWKRNLLMILACYLISVLVGVLLNIWPLMVDSFPFFV